jgi:hypothetical protein
LDKIKSFAGETSKSVKSLGDEAKIKTKKAFNSSRNSEVAQAKKFSIKQNETPEKKDEDLSFKSITSE